MTYLTTMYQPLKCWWTKS